MTDIVLDVCLIEWPEFLAVKAESRLEVQLSKTHDGKKKFIQLFHHLIFCQIV